MRVWFNGRTSASQAEDAGSIPVIRCEFPIEWLFKPFYGFFFYFLILIIRCYQFRVGALIENDTIVYMVIAFLKTEWYY